jgi:hypothetical protein
MEVGVRSSSKVVKSSYLIFNIYSISSQPNKLKREADKMFEAYRNMKTLVAQQHGIAEDCSLS